VAVRGSLCPGVQVGGSGGPGSRTPRQVARSLRVSTKSVYQWRRAWRAGGEAARRERLQAG
jgi:transposase-like protein